MLELGRIASVDATRGRCFIHWLALVALLALGTQSAAAVDSWAALGPHGGTTFALVVDPQSGGVYVGTKAGVFKSTDGGAHWVSANGNLPVNDDARGRWVMALAVDAGSPPAVYASVLLEGVYTSLDGGQTWRRSNSGLIGIHAEILVAAAEVPGTAYAATSGGLFRTTNGGDGWTQLPGIAGATALAVDPNASGTVYAGLGSGLSKTVDGGQTWTPIGAAVLEGLRIDALAVDPRSSNRVFAAAADFGAGSANLFRSVDGGSTWAPASSGLPTDQRITAIALPSSLPDVVYAAVVGAGVFKSTDGGMHWSVSHGDLDVVRALAADPAAGGSVYAAGSSSAASGVFKTADGGASWAFRSEGIAAFELKDVVVDPKTPSNLYALSFDQGILKSSDGGQTWKTVNNGLPAFGSQVFLGTLTIDPVDPRVLYASTTDGEMFKTVDGADHWVPIARPAAHEVLLALDVDPQDPRILVAGTSAGLFRSTDGGASWVRTRDSLGQFEAAELVRDPASPAAIYAAVFEVIIGSPPRPQGFLLESVDRGVSWSVVAEGFFSFLQIDPDAPSTLYATDGSQILRSTDAGAHWSVLARVPGPFASIRALLVDPRAPSTFIVDNGDELLRSDDSGASWRSWSEGLGNRDVYALVLDPAIPGRLYVATRGGGLSARLLSALVPCLPGPSRLCLNGGRFAAEVEWEDFSGNTGSGTSRELSSDTGAFWFFGPDNVELTVKVLDGRGLNGKFWVFYGSLTNVEFSLTVTDTATGRVRRYHNPKGTFASAGDTAAF